MNLQVDTGANSENTSAWLQIVSSYIYKIYEKDNSPISISKCFKHSSPSFFHNSLDLINSQLLNASWNLMQSKLKKINTIIRFSYLLRANCLLKWASNVFGFFSTLVCGNVSCVLSCNFVIWPPVVAARTSPEAISSGICLLSRVVWPTFATEQSENVSELREFFWSFSYSLIYHILNFLHKHM